MAAGTRTQGRKLALAASAAFHAVLFLLLAWRLGRMPPAPEPPIINVQLVRPSAPDEPRRESQRRAETTAVPPRILAAPPDSMPGAPVIQSPLAPAAEPGVRQALRRRVGCGHATLFGLSRAEREDCDERLADAARGANSELARLDLGKNGAFQPDNPEPYLARRPTKGCKVRAGGDKTPSGDDGAAAGIACAWPF